MSPNQRSKHHGVNWWNLYKHVFRCLLYMIEGTYFSRECLKYGISICLLFYFRVNDLISLKVNSTAVSSISESTELFQWNVLLYHFQVHPYFVHYRVYRLYNVFVYSLNLRKMVHIFLSKLGNTHWRPNCK